MDFSIVIPAKNEAHRIGLCLDSINALNFDRCRYEVLVIDNGSTDQTVAVAQTKNASVHEQPTLTIAGLRNYGASLARGQVLVFLDADCSVTTEWLNAASVYLDKPEISCFGSPPVVPAGATWVQRGWFHVRKTRHGVQAVEWFESMNMFVRREAFAACGGFDETLVTCEDYDLSLRLAKLGVLWSDERIVAIHHGEAATIRQFFRKEFWRATSNLQGAKRHGLVWRELPSLLAPPTHCFLLLSAALCLGFVHSPWAMVILSIFLAWQTFLLSISFWKTRPEPAWSLVGQLFLLLNVYFTARGLSIFHGRQR